MQNSRFQLRMFHLDLRIQVMTTKALNALADELASLGYQGIVMEWEASFPFKKHPIIPNRYAYTPEEVKAFLAHCKKLGLQTIPMQQCFGHIEYILQHDRYAHLREDEKEISQLCPLKVKEALPLFRDLFGELAKVHNSEYLFIGCDETYLLGKGPDCRKKAETKGKSRLFVDYVKEICALVTKLGKRPVLWADMLLHHPEAAGKLPRNVVLVDWNYGWKPDRFGNPAPLLKTGLEFWGAPALRSHPDSYYLTCWEKHLNNFRDFLPYCRAQGYSAAVLTSWSTSGIYGFEWESQYEPLVMHPIRRVYPLIGFRMLLAAFAEAADSALSFNPDAFVRRYAAERFGLSKKEAADFLKAIKADPSVVYDVSSAPHPAAAKVLRNVKPCQAILNRIRPRAHREEFAHFCLMMDIRAHFLEFKTLEAHAQSTAFGDVERKQMAGKLSQLLQQSDALGRRFSAIIKGYLHASEIAEENRVRRRKIVELQCRLARKR